VLPAALAPDHPPEEDLCQRPPIACNSDVRRTQRAARARAAVMPTPLLLLLLLLLRVWL
jgi:hypothetical protein